MAIDIPTSKIVVIDTNSYSGDFEREMCAFITGQVGECGVGADLAEEARESLRFLGWHDEHVTAEEDEHGCRRPASIWPTPGRFNDGYGGHYDDTPEVRAMLKGSRATARLPAYESVAIFVDVLPPADVLAEMVERARQYCTENDIVYRGYRLLEPRFKTKEIIVVAGHDEVGRG